jgi:hypothetical protein
VAAIVFRSQQPAGGVLGKSQSVPACRMIAEERNGRKGWQFSVVDERMPLIQVQATSTGLLPRANLTAPYIWQENKTHRYCPNSFPTIKPSSIKTNTRS